MPGVQKPPPVGQVLVSQENLRHFHAESFKRLLVGPHQPALTDRRRGLFDRQALGVVLEGEFLDAGDNRAG